MNDQSIHLCCKTDILLSTHTIRLKISRTVGPLYIRDSIYVVIVGVIRIISSIAKSRFHVITVWVTRIISSIVESQFHVINIVVIRIISAIVKSRCYVITVGVIPIISAIVKSGSLLVKFGVGGAVGFLVVGTIGQEERPPQGQLWMEQCLTSLKYLSIQYTIWADPNYTWGLAILADSLPFSVNNILAGLWLNCISSVEITLFLLADILLQHMA